MDFAKQQLEKYGWSEGKGLGKNESGIAIALKPKLKFDTSGLGHNSSEQFTFNWWENVYKQASDNVNVTTENGAVEVKITDRDAVTITTKEYLIKGLSKNKRKTSSTIYGSFIKSNPMEDTVSESEVDHLQTKLENMNKLSDEELFAFCGGRTAHKGARHGLKLSGKLARLELQEKQLLNDSTGDAVVKQKKYVNKFTEEKQAKLWKEEKFLRKQEKQLLRKLNNISLSETDDTSKKLKKKFKKCKDSLQMTNEEQKKTSSKKKKKKKKEREESEENKCYLESMTSQQLSTTKDEIDVSLKKKKHKLRKRSATKLFLDSLGISNTGQETESESPDDIENIIQCLTITDDQKPSVKSKREELLISEKFKKRDCDKVKSKIARRKKKKLKKKKLKEFAKSLKA